MLPKVKKGEKAVSVLIGTKKQEDGKKEIWPAYHQEVKSDSRSFGPSGSKEFFTSIKGKDMSFKVISESDSLDTVNGCAGNKMRSVRIEEELNKFLKMLE